MKLARSFAILLLTSAASAGAEEDWRYSVGVHDFTVPGATSHTFGINGSVSIDKRRDSGQHVFGYVDLLLDYDKDHLDSDHIPLWWQIHLGSDGDFWRGGQMRVGWTADIDTRENTVSGVERQFTLLPAFVAGYDSQILQASLEAGAGWFYLELDDDAPRQQGYPRSALKNSSLGYATTVKLTLKLSESWSLSGLARGWWDKQRPLEGQGKVALRMDASRWLGANSMKQPALVLSADYYKYNLDVYNHSKLTPILRWDDDLMIRLVIEAKW